MRYQNKHGVTRRQLAHLTGFGISAPAMTGSAQTPNNAFPTAEGLTAQLAAFITKMEYSSIPADVIELGKKSILDSIGLALAASASETLALARKYVSSIGLS